MSDEAAWVRIEAQTKSAQLVERIKALELKLKQLEEKIEEQAYEITELTGYIDNLYNR